MSVPSAFSVELYQSIFVLLFSIESIFSSEYWWKASLIPVCLLHILLRFLEKYTFNEFLVTYMHKCTDSSYWRLVISYCQAEILCLFDPWRQDSLPEVLLFSLLSVYTQDPVCPFKTGFVQPRKKQSLFHLSVYWVLTQKMMECTKTNS